MNREEAIKILSSYDVNGVWADVDGKPYNAEEQAEAFDMAIEALEGVCFDEWCDDCKEYDTEKKCCPRFNKVIREALKHEPSEDGTLEVKVEDATKVGRVLITDDKHRGGLYYPDEDEPQGVSFENNAKIKSCSKDSDLISRAEAIEAMCRECGSMEEYGTCSACGCAEKNAIEALPSADRPTDGDLISRAEAIEALGEEPPVWCDEEDEIAERNQWRADIEAIKSVPSADRQMVIKCKPFLSEEDFKAFAKQVSDQNVILIPNEAEVVSTNTSTNTSTKSTNISTDTSADRPRGKWISDEYEIPHCSECDCINNTIYRNFCPNCGADMRTTKGAE